MANKFGNEGFRPLHVRDTLMFERGNVKGFATQGGETGVSAPIGPNSNPGGFPDVPFVIGVYSAFGEATQPGNIRVVDVENLFNFAGTVQITSGQSIASVRGGASIAVGTTIASGGFIYGVQGKVIVQGTINSGSAFCAALFGQFDTSGASATLTSGYNAALVLDMGATSHLASSTVLDGEVILNTTACLMNSAIRVVANATQLFDITDLNGGGPHFANTSAALPTTSGGQLKVLVNGVVRYIPLYSTSI